MIDPIAKECQYPCAVHSGLRPGMMVPFIPGGIDSNQAMILGLCREEEQYVLMIYIEEAVNGKYEQTRRIFQRDRKTIEGLYIDRVNRRLS